MTWTTRRVSEVAPDGTAYELSGPEGAPLVALIHGLGLCRDVWAGLLPEFAAHYRVLNYDLYGHGASAPVPGDASLTVYSDQLAGLLDHVGADRAAVVGFSIGGMINRRFALDHRDRLTALVILNSPHDRGAEGQKAVEDRAATVRDQGAFATFDEALKRWFTPGFLASGAAAPQLVRDWRAQVDPESYAQAAWVLANGVRELIAPDPAITAPTLVVTCENDSGSTPAMARQIAAEIPGAALAIVPALQHLGLMEAPRAFTAPTLEFLERTLK
ncbi:MAG: alpha/beta fold hydrolase [Rhodobacteraceae bacterium]|nr:alpha/beta fold hydrolase [Paracoccaceae bacterium]